VVCRNLLADVANLLRNARFVWFAKDYIQPPQSYGSPQTAANRNNQPQKKIPDEGVSNITNSYTFSWDIVVFFYKSAYYYKDIFIGAAVSFIG
jgi:hypothetical protein